ARRQRPRADPQQADRDTKSVHAELVEAPREASSGSARTVRRHQTAWLTLVAGAAALRSVKTAIVMRETQVSSPASLVMSICHTCVVRPRCTGRAVPVTQPVMAERKWLALMSSPTARWPSGAE